MEMLKQCLSLAASSISVIPGRSRMSHFLGSWKLPRSLSPFQPSLTDCKVLCYWIWINSRSVLLIHIQIVFLLHMGGRRKSFMQTSSSGASHRQQAARIQDWGHPREASELALESKGSCSSLIPWLESLSVRRTTISLLSPWRLLSHIELYCWNTELKLSVQRTQKRSTVLCHHITDSH